MSEETNDVRTTVPHTPSAFARDLEALPEERKQVLIKALERAKQSPVPLTGDMEEYVAQIRRDTTTSGVLSTSGFVPYSLEAPALNLWSEYTKFLQMIPRNSSYGSSGHNWKRITAVDSAASYGSVAEPNDTTANSTAGRSGFNQITTQSASVAYEWMNLDGLVTWKARATAKSGAFATPAFNPDQIARLSTLSAFRQRQERRLIGGNATQINAPGAPSKATTQLATGVGSLANGTAYKFTISALTYLGYWNLSKGGNGATSAVGETTAAASTALSTTAGGNPGDKSLVITWTDIPGAFAYNVYGGGNGGDERQYLCTVTTNRAVITSVPPGAATTVPNVANTTADANTPDGLLKLLVSNAGYTSTGNNVLTGTKNYIDQFDAAFLYQAENYKLGATKIFMSPRTMRRAIDVIAGSTNPYLRIDVANGETNLVGGLGVKGVNNVYMQKQVEFVPHLLLPPGVAIGWCDNLGENYPYGNIPVPVEMGVGQEYLNVDYGITGARQEFGIFVSEAPIMWAGFPLFIIKNICDALVTSDTTSSNF